MYCKICGRGLPDGTAVCEECKAAVSPAVQAVPSGNGTGKTTPKRIRQTEQEAAAGLIWIINHFPALMRTRDKPTEIHWIPPERGLTGRTLMDRMLTGRAPIEYRDRQIPAGQALPSHL